MCGTTTLCHRGERERDIRTVRPHYGGLVEAAAPEDQKLHHEKRERKTRMSLRAPRRRVGWPSGSNYTVGAPADRK